MFFLAHTVIETAFQWEERQGAVWWIQEAVANPLDIIVSLVELSPVVSSFGCPLE